LEKQIADLIWHEHNFLSRKPVLGIRNGFYADPDTGHILPSQKVIYLEKGWNVGLFVNFSQVPCSPIWIRIGKADPDPVEPKQSGSMLTWIQNTVKKHSTNAEMYCTLQKN
jgi:hypothetical protein